MATSNSTTLARKRLWIILGLVSVVIVATLYVLKIQGIGLIEYQIMVRSRDDTGEKTNSKTFTAATPTKLATTQQTSQKSSRIVTTDQARATTIKATTQIKPTTHVKPTTQKVVVTTMTETMTPKPTTSHVTTKPKPTPTSKLPLILYWTGWFGERWPTQYYSKVNCHNVSCIFTDRKAQYQQADALIFHGSDPIMKSKAFYPPRSQKPSNQIWVYHNLENPILTRKLNGKGVSSIHNNIFNVVNSYTRDGMAFSPYAYIVKGDFSQNYDPNKDYSKGKTKLIAWASSQCYPGRTQFVQKFSQLINIDTYGKCGKIKCGRTKDCWDIIAKQHKFYLSFENYICKDYVTEKFYRNGLALGMVPIVIGGANYSNPSIGPPGSYINALDFPSLSDLVKYIKKVAKDKTLYNSYFKWKASYKIIYKDTDGSLCQVCQNLHNQQWVKAASKHIVENLAKVWGDEKKFCTDYPGNIDHLALKFPWKS